MVECFEARSTLLRARLASEKQEVFWQIRKSHQPETLNPKPLNPKPPVCCGLHQKAGGFDSFADASGFVVEFLGFAWLQRPSPKPYLNLKPGGVGGDGGRRGRFDLRV